MEFPKLMIASDGKRTAALLDGVFLADGIRRLDFSTQDVDGKMRSTIRILELDVNDSDLSCGPDEFARFVKHFGAKYSHEKNIGKSAPATTSADSSND